MSFNRENVTWQGKDGRWNMAFFRTTWVGSPADGYDPEWDVEYDFAEFDLYAYALGKESPEAAFQEATRHTANPGGGLLMSRTTDPGDCDKYDLMLKRALDKKALQEQDRIRLERWSAK